MIKPIKYKFLLFLPFVLHIVVAGGQETPLDISVNVRVDTSQPKIREVYNLYVNYLHSRPDSFYKNPYWSKQERERYSKCMNFFDHSAFFIYRRQNAFEVLKPYKINILSIDPVRDKYKIRTMFYRKEVNNAAQDEMNPPWITIHYAVQENGEWRLQNAMNEVTRHWHRQSYKYINFIYPPSHDYDQKLAEKSAQFCDSIAQQFNIEIAPFDYYLTSSPDKYLRLLNFDYKATSSKAMANARCGFMLSSYGSEWNPHEFVHMLFPVPKDSNTLGIINEGLATYLAGPGGMSFDSARTKVATRWAHNDTVTFTDIFNQEYDYGMKYKFSTPYYVTGGIICKWIYEEKGASGIKQLLTVGSRKELYEIIHQQLGLTKAQFNNQIIKELKEAPE